MRGLLNSHLCDVLLRGRARYGTIRSSLGRTAGFTGRRKISRLLPLCFPEESEIMVANYDHHTCL